MEFWEMQFSLVKSDDPLRSCPNVQSQRWQAMVGARAGGLVIIVFHDHTGTWRISEGSNVDIRGWDKKFIYHHNCSKGTARLYICIYSIYLSLSPIPNNHS